MRSLTILVLLTLASPVPARGAAACDALVVGQDSQCSFGNGSRVTDAATFLAGLGYAVTAMPAYPASLAAFDLVWDPRCATPLSGSEMTDLAGFLAAGGGLFLQGEYPGVDNGRNASIVTFLSSNACAGGVAIDPSAVVSPGGSPTQLFNPAAPACLPTVPNNLVGIPITPAGAGQFNSYGTGGVWIVSGDVGGAWESSALCGAGRVAILLDSNWLDLGGGYDTTENLQMAENLADWLCGGACGVPTAPPTATPSVTPTRTATRTQAPTVVVVTPCSAGAPHFSVSANALLDGGTVFFCYAFTADVAAALRIYDSAGQLVRTLAEHAADRGRAYTSSWDGRNDEDHACATGIYIVRLTGGTTAENARIAWIRGGT